MNELIPLKAFSKAHHGAECEAKAALLNYVARNEKLHNSTIISELTISGYTNRADLVIIDDYIHCYEIKTRTDSLRRLPQQCSIYSKVFDRTTIVAARNHIRNIRSLADSNIGLFCLENDNSITPIRKPKLKPKRDTIGLAELLPLSVLRSLTKTAPPAGRDEVTRQFALFGPEWIREKTLAFLHHRYRQSNLAFKEATRELITPDHVSLLKAWGAPDRKSDTGILSNGIPLEHEIDVFSRLRRCFGEVPQDIQDMLFAYA